MDNALDKGSEALLDRAGGLILRVLDGDEPEVRLGQNAIQPINTHRAI